MPAFFRTRRFFLIGTAALTLSATLLRTLALTLSANPASGYFLPGAVLPLLYQVVTAIGAIALVLFPVFALKGHLPVARAPRTRYQALAAAPVALLLFINFIVGCTLSGTALPTLILVIGLVALLAAVLYFILQLLPRVANESLSAVMGCLSILALACLIAFTYFDVATPMNAPQKTDLHMALLAVMLYLLYELRADAGIPLPRMLRLTAGLAFFLSVTVGLSHLIATLAGLYAPSVYLAQAMLLLTLAAYIGVRTVADAALPSPEEKERDDTK